MPRTGWVKVQWDSGDAWKYRMGYHGYYDLSVADKDDSNGNPIGGN